MHHGYFGVTQSGKTTHARAMARELDRLGQKTIVYDPVGTATAGGGWPERAKVFEDFGEFMDYVERDDVFQAHLFVDESGDHFGVSDKENHWLLRRGRHKGFVMHMIAQRPKMLAPNVRTQLGKVFVYRLSHTDAEEIGRDMGHTDFGNMASGLDTGEYFALISGSPQISRGNIFNQLGKAPKKVSK